MRPEGPFAPVAEVTAIMADFRRPWAIAGGWALDLFLGRVTRDHADVDVAIFRRDQRDLRASLDCWSFEKVVGGRRVPWPEGEWLDLPVHELHASREVGSPREIEFLLNEAKGKNWIFRRDERIERPMSKTILATRSGMPYLAPSVVLLFKAKDPTPKDIGDFEVVRPHLRFAHRLWLRGALETAHPGHPWIGRL